MTPPALAFERYTSGTRSEWIMRIGAVHAPAFLFVPPLFEEMNRTRALMAAIMRGAAAQGLSCWLPDLGGTGESEAALETIGWDDWRDDVAAAAAHVAAVTGAEPLIASLRGGVLLDDAASGRGHWRFAPAEGRALVRDLNRASLAGGADWGGYPAAQPLREDLEGASVAAVTPLRTVRLASDAQAADLKVDGPALWRRSEPGVDAALGGTLANDIVQWSAACGG